MLVQEAVRGAHASMHARDCCALRHTQRFLCRRSAFPLCHTHRSVRGRALSPWPTPMRGPTLVAGAASAQTAHVAEAPSSGGLALSILSDPRLEGEPLRFLKLSEAYWTVRELWPSCTGCLCSGPLLPCGCAAKPAGRPDTNALPCFFPHTSLRCPPHHLSTPRVCYPLGYTVLSTALLPPATEGRTPPHARHRLQPAAL